MKGIKTGFEEIILRETRITIAKKIKRQHTPGESPVNGTSIKSSCTTTVYGETIFQASRDGVLLKDEMLATFEFAISTDAQLEMILRSALSELGLK